MILEKRRCTFVDAILFGKYQLLQVIGTGRTCEVYLARHIGLEEYRAIKKIPRTSVDHTDFRKEATILKGLKAPGIPVIYDLEEDEDYFYLIEEYLEGLSLQELAEKEGTLSKAMTVSVGIQICRLVFYLHSAEPNPILYLDLQPKNLLLCHDTVKLIDFGQAIFLRDAGNLKKRYGTVGYAAPEQYTEDELDERTDIYAIGQIMHFLLTGRAAGKGGTKAGWNPVSLEKIIDRCLETEKEKRYPSVTVLCEELEKIQKDGDRKDHISSLTIAFAGNKSGVGTTHLAIGLSAYLKIQGFPCLYEEKNGSNAVRLMAEYESAAFDSFGICRISGLLMKPLYGPAVRLKEPGGMTRVFDYGTKWQEMTSSLADVQIMVNGGKPWDVNIPDDSGSAFVICNMAAPGVRIGRDRQRKGTVYMKAPYFESPFDLSPEGMDFYASLMNRIWKGWEKKDREWVFWRCFKKAKSIMKGISVRS